VWCVCVGVCVCVCVCVCLRRITMGKRIAFFATLLGLIHSTAAIGFYLK